MRLATVVEGHGDVAALPILLRRLLPADRLGTVEFPRPIRLPRGKLVQPREIERVIEFAARQTTVDDGILIVADADADCARDLGTQMLGWARTARPDRRIGVVLAVREFEAWFVAAAATLGSQRGLPSVLASPPDPESIADPKGWLGSRMTGTSGYRETIDQPAFAARFDPFEAMTRAPSLRKLQRDLLRLLGPG